MSEDYLDSILIFERNQFNLVNHIWSFPSCSDDLEHVIQKVFIHYYKVYYKMYDLILLYNQIEASFYCLWRSK